MCEMWQRAACRARSEHLWANMRKTNMTADETCVPCWLIDQHTPSALLLRKSWSSSLISFCAMCRASWKMPRICSSLSCLYCRMWSMLEMIPSSTFTRKGCTQHTFSDVTLCSSYDTTHTFSDVTLCSSYHMTHTFSDLTRLPSKAKTPEGK